MILVVRNDQVLHMIEHMTKSSLFVIYSLEKQFYSFFLSFILITKHSQSLLVYVVTPSE